MALLFTPYMTAAAAPLERGSTEVGGSGFLRFPSPADSLGGVKSRSPLPLVDNLPFLLGGYWEHPDNTVLGSGAYRLFDDLSAAELTAGKTDYRALFFVNEGTSANNITVWLDQPRSGTGTITIWRPTPSSSGFIERLLTETTAPTGPSFSSPSSGSPLTIGSVSGSGAGSFPLYIKRVINAGTAAYAYDYFKITLSDGTNQWQYVIFYTLKSSAASLTVSGTLDGSTITTQTGDVFTVTVKNSSGSAVDPAGSQVFATFAQTFPAATRNAESSLVAPPYRPTGAVFVPGKRTAQGVYDIPFRPTRPGHYQMVLDIGGGELTAQRSIEVSPIGDPV